ncbi:MAG: Holliday junction branch migration protein RuvA [Anaerolineae bacterium]
MIAQLVGEVTHVAEGFIILDVGGVGFGVYVPTDLALRVGDRAVMHTYLQVRENELTLYGFADLDEKQLFEMLLGVSGVGPKAALSLMSTLSPDTLRRAILNGQPEVLARAPGVGKKTGQAIVLHLKDKIKRYTGVEVEVSEDDADIIAALTALGFSIVESQRALQQLPRDEDLSLDEKIRRALTFLGR